MLLDFIWNLLPGIWSLVLISSWTSQSQMAQTEFIIPLPPSNLLFPLLISQWMVVMIRITHSGTILIFPCPPYNFSFTRSYIFSSSISQLCLLFSAPSAATLILLTSIFPWLLVTTYWLLSPSTFLLFLILCSIP